MKSSKINRIVLIIFFIPVLSFAQIPKPDPLEKWKLIKFNLSKFFDKKRPVCIVLIHGITNSVETSNRLIRENKAPNCPVNTLKFARHTWGFDFIQGLFGSESDPIHTFSSSGLTEEGALYFNNWETDHVRDNIARDHILTAGGRPNPYDNGPNSYIGFLTVMMTYRDGSLSLKKQTAATAAQIKSIYDRVFGSWPAKKRPQLILLCHSGGGIVARTICTIPESLGGGISSLGDKLIKRERFTSNEKVNLDFVRNRTMYIITLATPHEGAPIAKVSNQIGQYIDFIPAIGDQDPGIPILKELTPNIMQDYNREQLNPTKCIRADGTLIPIYCLGGRAAAGPYYFNDPNQYDNDLETPDGGIILTKSQIVYEKKINGVSNRKEFESYGLLKADYLTTLLYGITSFAMIGPQLLSEGIAGVSTGFDMRFMITPLGSPELDIVKMKNNGLFGCLDSPVFNFFDFIAGPKIFYLRNEWSNNLNTLRFCTGSYSNNGPSTSGDGLIDCDGFVPIISALAVNLGTNVKNYFSNTNGGNFYRFYRSAADYDHHGSIMNRYEVSEFIRQNITCVSKYSNIFNNGIIDTSAGPYVNTTNFKSIWR